MIKALSTIGVAAVLSFLSAACSLDTTPVNGKQRCSTGLESRCGKGFWCAEDGYCWLRGTSPPAMPEDSQSDIPGPEIPDANIQNGADKNYGRDGSGLADLKEAVSCKAGTKLCNGLCESTDSPTIGCGEESCEPCQVTSSSLIAVCEKQRCAAVCSNNRFDCNMLKADGCEVDLSADPANCGKCSHTCESGSCDDGLCKPKALVTGEDGPLGIVAAGDRIFWSLPFKGKVRSVQKSGGVDILDVASDQRKPSWFTADSTHIFWTNRSVDKQYTGSIWKANLDGTSPRVLIGELRFPDRVALRGDEIVWTTGGTQGSVFIAKRADGSVPAQVGGYQDLTGPVVALNDWIIWTFAGGVQSLLHPRAEGGSVSKYPIDGTGIAASRIYVYWTEGASTIRRALPNLSEAADFVQTTSPPYSLVFDEGWLYWTVPTAGLIQGAQEGDRKIHTFAKGQGGPTGLAVDGRYLYWTNNKGGEIMRVER